MSAVHPLRERRSAMLEDLQRNVPHELRELSAWLLFRLEPKEGKPDEWDKVPYYADGKKRHGKQGSPEDAEHLADFPTAMQALTGPRGAWFDGVGFALLPCHPATALDLDKLAGDPERRELAGAVLASGTYVETSPSGNGQRAFFAGKAELGNVKNHAAGVEVFESSGFVTITGAELSDGAGLEPMPDTLRARLAAILSKPKNRPTPQARPVLGKFDLNRLPLDLAPRVVAGFPPGAKDRSAYLYWRAFDLRRGGLSDREALEVLGDPDLPWIVPALERRGGDIEGARDWLWEYTVLPAYAQPMDAGGRAGQRSAPQDWPEPLPLIGDHVALPYPVDALPGAIGDAVREVVAFVQCPAALAACSALSVVSVAAQALADVRRGSALIGPVSLYFLPIAESGERKTECDRQFGTPLREWEAEERERVRPDVARSRAELAAWEAERESLVQEIKRQARKGGDAVHELRSKLAELESVKPEPVRVPRLLMESETPENLAWTLARPDGWPSAGLLSSEAGVIFGGHAMRRDSIMQSLALFNKLWSGETYRVGRRTSESFELAGVRLTMGLATQPETVQAFFEESRGLARGTGFAARFLIAWPESTQGTREYRDAPEGWPGLTQFKARIRRLLETRATVNPRGELIPPPLDMEPEAFEGWKRFYNGSERELRSGGELADVRDVASKAADNVARMAALFHLFEHGPGGRIGADHLARAARIVTWHLAESRRFLGGLAVPKPVANAVKLDAWLVDACRKGQTDSIPKRDVQRLGPYPIRRKAELMAALGELRDTERAQLSEDGRTIRINPALLRG